MAKAKKKSARSKKFSPSDRLRVLRKRLGLTQGRLAELLGVHAMTVSKWERGLLEPTPYQAAILQALDVEAPMPRPPASGVRELSAYLNHALVDVTEIQGMKLSASNQLRGRVVALERGPISARVVIEIAPGVRITSLITTASVDRLGLELDREAVAIIKATEVIVGVQD